MSKPSYPLYFHQLSECTQPLCLQKSGNALKKAINVRQSFPNNFVCVPLRNLSKHIQNSWSPFRSLDLLFFWEFWKILSRKKSLCICLKKENFQCLFWQIWDFKAKPKTSIFGSWKWFKEESLTCVLSEHPHTHVLHQVYWKNWIQY